MDGQIYCIYPIHELIIALQIPPPYLLDVPSPLKDDELLLSCRVTDESPALIFLT